MALTSRDFGTPREYMEVVVANSKRERDFGHMFLQAFDTYALLALINAQTSLRWRPGK